MKKLLLSAATAILMSVTASHATEKYVPMTIDFVGDWCFNSEDNNETNYQLPSWHQDSPCRNIFSVIAFTSQTHSEQQRWPYKQYQTGQYRCSSSRSPVRSAPGRPMVQFLRTVAS
jgi:hypothetical protein